MKKSHYPLQISYKKYALNKFEVKPYSETESLFSLYYLNQKIGFFSRTTDLITTNCNGKNKYFFIRHIYNPQIYPLPSHEHNEVIGTISFEFGDKSKKWKIGYVKLTSIPEQFLFDRKVLFEKLHVSQFKKTF